MAATSSSKPRSLLFWAPNRCLILASYETVSLTADVPEVVLIFPCRFNFIIFCLISSSRDIRLAERDVDDEVGKVGYKVLCSGGFAGHGLVCCGGMFPDDDNRASQKRGAMAVRARIHSAETVDRILERRIILVRRRLVNNMDRIEGLVLA